MESSESSESSLFMVEIGVDLGQTSETLLQALPNLTLLGVDPYPGLYKGEHSGERLDSMGSEDSMRNSARDGDETLRWLELRGNFRSEEMGAHSHIYIDI